MSAFGIDDLYRQVNKLVKYVLQECDLFLISLQLYYGLDLSFRQNNKVLVAVVSEFLVWVFCCFLF